MKKEFRLVGLMLMAVVGLGLVACGSDGDGDKDDGVDTTPISLLAGKNKVIQGADTISTSNKFVAYATKNTVHAWHVGEAALLVNGKKTISISVLPEYHLYDDPICEWECSMDYVKGHQKQGSISSKSTDKVLAYENAGAASYLAYMFENGKLKSIGAIVSTNHTTQYASYLSERFLMLPYYSGADTYFIGADGLTLEEAKTVAVLQVYSSKELVTIYMPAKDYSPTTRSAQEENEIVSRTISLIGQLQ